MYDLKSIGSPRARELHQQIIAGTIYNMWPEIVEARRWKLLGEATVTDDPNDNYPDIIIKDPHKRLVFCLEISHGVSLTIAANVSCCNDVFRKRSSLSITTRKTFSIAWAMMVYGIAV